MSNLYYNGVLLPQIPTEALGNYHHFYIYENTNKYYLQCSVTPCYYVSSENTIQPGVSTNIVRGFSNYYIEKNNMTTDWTFQNNDAYLYILDNFPLLWSMNSIPYDSTTGPTFWRHGTQPTRTLSEVQLVNQGEESSSELTTCTISMKNCTVGNLLLLAYAVRGEENDPHLTVGWTKLGGGNKVDTSSNINQKIYFAYKFVASETETVTIEQTVTIPMYMVCSEYTNVKSVTISDDLASSGTTDYEVTCTKDLTNVAFVYGVTSVYYGNGRYQQVTKSDLTKIDGDSTAERLACWFDSGQGLLKHTFRTYNRSESYPAIAEVVQLNYGNPEEEGLKQTSYEVEALTLKAIADAIRTKKGVTRDIKVANFAKEITGIIKSSDETIDIPIAEEDRF